MDTFPLEFHQPHSHVRSFFRAHWFAGGFLGALILLALANGLLLFLPADRIAWGTQVAGQNVGYLTQEEARVRISPALPSPEPYTLSVVAKNKVWTVESPEFGQYKDIETALTQARTQSHQGNILEQWRYRVDALTGGIDIPAAEKLQPERIASWVASRSAEVDDFGVRPQASLKGSTLTLTEGRAGEVVAQEPLVTALMHAAPGASIAAELEPTNIPLSADARITAQTRLEKLRTKTIELTGEETDRSITLSAPTFFPWLSLPYGVHTPTVKTALAERTRPYEREPQNARWKVDASGKKLEEFAPHRTGRTVDLDRLLLDIEAALLSFEQPDGPSKASIGLPFRQTDPEITLEKTNTLGVKERIGVGTSYYAHSIPNRIHNVGLTSSRVDATLVLPGEEFSFNAAVGEINQATGYKTAYVIKDGMTQLGDGGGVCQVSTTVFRAALNAGLPITRWKAHSYRVSYYEQNSQPGFDATVYSPSTDFRFKNDTPGALVVTSHADGQNQHMVVELWGTSDGRTSTVDNYSISNQRPAPETQFIDDPTLPRGTRKQIDWSAPGATTRFSYTVKNADGSEKMKRDFVSNFRPWRAVFLVGTGD